MTDDAKPGTGISNRWSFREERADFKRIVEAYEARLKRRPKTAPAVGVG